ncbi:helix-turn-helix domain-containing protein [Mesorhizobium sp. WSM4935]|uniref:helix-turn-helix domain-containing protein n=1 Tax=Mesorhizobium sp. WSM4935 TaxID=3038547 RepID=UPI003FA59B1B
MHLSDRELTLELLMKELGMSRSRLYRAFHHAGGVARYIQRRRFLAARAALLRESHHRIHEIAYRYGFPLASDFTRAFRREFGYSPSEARDRRNEHC